MHVNRSGVPQCYDFKLWLFVSETEKLSFSRSVCCFDKGNVCRQFAHIWSWDF